MIPQRWRRRCGSSYDQRKLYNILCFWLEIPHFDSMSSVRQGANACPPLNVWQGVVVCKQSITYPDSFASSKSFSKLINSRLTKHFSSAPWRSLALFWRSVSWPRRERGLHNTKGDLGGVRNRLLTLFCVYSFSLSSEGGKLLWFSLRHIT